MASELASGGPRSSRGGGAGTRTRARPGPGAREAREEPEPFARGVILGERLEPLGARAEENTRLRQPERRRRVARRDRERGVAQRTGSLRVIFSYQPG
jgi:hypothetical protein